MSVYKLRLTPYGPILPCCYGLVVALIKLIDFLALLGNLLLLAYLPYYLPTLR
jgi:hypothetical protein